MRSAMIAIWKKDVGGSLSQPLFYILIGLTLLILGLFFLFQVQQFSLQSLQQQGETKGLSVFHHLIVNYVVVTHYLLLLLIAILSLNYFASEKREKTFQIYLTSPLSSWEIVLAKWFVGASMVFFLVLASAIFPLSLTLFTRLDWAMVSFLYLGLFLVLLIYMSLSLLASALTHSLVVCVVLSMTFILLTLLLGAGRELTTVAWLQDLFTYLSVDVHFGYFKKGLLHIGSLVYLLSFSGFVCLLTERVIEAQRWK